MKPSLRAKRIVVADGDHVLRRLLVGYLESEACFVVEVANALELASVLVGDEVPHLLLIDSWLGDASALEIIRRHPPLNGGVWPTVLMSAHLRSRDIALAMKVGVARTLLKPFDSATLKEVVLCALDDVSRKQNVGDRRTVLDLLQAVHVGQRTLGFAIAGNPAGSVTLVRGEVVDARCGALAGEQALDLLLQRSAKWVQPFDTPRAIQTSVDSVPFHVLLAAARQRIGGGRRYRTLTRRDSAVVMAATGLKRTDADEALGSPVLSESAVPIAGSPPQTGCAQSSLPPPPSSRDSSSSSSSAPPFSAPTVPTMLCVPRSVGTEDEEHSVLEEDEGEPLATTAELVLLSERGTLIEDLHFGRVNQLRLSMQWLTPRNAITLDIRSLVSQVVSLAVIDEERPWNQWLTVIRRDRNGVELGVSVFGQRPWVSAAALSGRLRRARFLSTTSRLATSSANFVEAEFSRQPQVVLADMEVDGLDVALSQLCRTFVDAVPAVEACMLARQYPASAKPRRGLFGARVDEVVADQRWRTAERVLSTLVGADDVEVFIGTTSAGLQILMGLALDGQWLLLCLSSALQTLGALRNKVRARLPWLRDALNNKQYNGIRPNEPYECNRRNPTDCPGMPGSGLG